MTKTRPGTIAILAIAAIFFMQGCVGSASQQNNVVVASSQQEIFYGEELKAQAESTEPGTNELEISLGQESKKIICSMGPCKGEAIFNPKPGVYNLVATAMLDSGAKQKSPALKITVKPSGQKCVDGTPEGKCSESKPKLCAKGVLSDDCGACGCNAGERCAEKSCAMIAGKLRNALASCPKSVISGEPFSVSVSAKTNGEVAAGAKYAATITGLGYNAISQEAVMPEGAEEMAFVFKGISIASPGRHLLDAKVYAANETLEETGSASCTIEVSPKQGSLAVPGKPDLLPIVAEGDDAVITWLAVDGAAEYRIYKSTEANSTYIQYAVAKTLPASETSSVLQALESGAHYFFVAAVNPAGVEGPYSEVKAIEIR